MDVYKITTAKGACEGTLLACLRWQAEYQGAMATIYAPDGRACCIHGAPYVEVDLDITVAHEHDAYRDETDLTPEEAAERVKAWFAGQPTR